MRSRSFKWWKLDQPGGFSSQFYCRCGASWGTVMPYQSVPLWVRYWSCLELQRALTESDNTPEVLIWGYMSPQSPLLKVEAYLHYISLSLILETSSRAPSRFRAPWLDSLMLQRDWVESRGLYMSTPKLFRVMFEVKDFWPSPLILQRALFQGEDLWLSLHSLLVWG